MGGTGCANGTSHKNTLIDKNLREFFWIAIDNQENESMAP